MRTLSNENKQKKTKKYYSIWPMQLAWVRARMRDESKSFPISVAGWMLKWKALLHILGMHM